MPGDGDVGQRPNCHYVQRSGAMRLTPMIKTQARMKRPFDHNTKSNEMNSKANKNVLTNISRNEANKRLRSSASPPTTPTQKRKPSFTLSTAQQEAHLAAHDPRKPHPKETPRHLEYDPMSPWEKRGG